LLFFAVEFRFFERKSTSTAKPTVRRIAAALVLMASALASRVLGLVREGLLAARLGTGAEADAYATTEAMRGWLGGARRSIGDIADSLRRHYALAGVGVVVAEATLVSHYRTMDDGGIPNVQVCRLSIDWLETHAADIKGRVQACSPCSWPSRPPSCRPPNSSNSPAPTAQTSSLPAAGDAASPTPSGCTAVCMS
jgi:hypothetical protein